ncbi:MAG: aromatic ring-hydroxylating dioxygenase subunit alpha [Pseudomonadales bacterium]|nr:aromatic ring-hydroxylating dioxygenase subunit alpha [Pseudomonadales bacterium]
MSAIKADTIIEPYVLENRGQSLFQVNRRVFVDDKILTLEERRIFDKCWLYIGHESELPEPGDFLTRDVGGRELIFVRSQDDVVRAFFNTCPHRGAIVCREKQGNEKMFRCMYHAWAFDLGGKLISRPEDERYHAEGGDDIHDLVSVAHLENYRGLYFVNFDEAATEDLSSYLAGAKEFIDLTVDQSEVGMEIVGGTQEYGFDANWKLLAENSFDGYHGMPTHTTYFDYVIAAGGQLGDAGTRVNEIHDLGNGHAAIEYGGPWGRPVAKSVAGWGEQGEADTAALRAGLERRFGKERADRIAYHNFNMLIFPNLVINNIMAVTFRTFYPQAANKQHVKAWALAPKDESKIMRQRRLYNFLEFLGPGGFATPDDCEALKMCQQGYQNLNYTAWNDISKGMGENSQITTDEEQMRVFWREWDRRIQGAEK